MKSRWIVQSRLHLIAVMRSNTDEVAEHSREKRGSGTMATGNEHDELQRSYFDAPDRCRNQAER